MAKLITLGRNKNGFYPANEKMLQFVYEPARAKYVGNFVSVVKTYPCKFVLIAVQNGDGQCYFQTLTIDNQKQQIAMLQVALLCANVIYEMDFDSSATQLVHGMPMPISPDHILDFKELAAIQKIK